MRNFRTVNRCLVGVVAVTAGLLLVSGFAWGETLDGSPIPKQVRSGGVGVKLGVINTGIIKAGSKRKDPAGSISFGVFFNVPLASRVMISPAFDLHNIHVDAVHEFMADFSLAIKPVFYQKRAGIAIRPSLAFGLGQMSTWDVIEDATTYLSVKSYLELAFFSRSKTAWLLEVGYTAFPVGGNSTIDASIKPSLTVRIGIEI